jgi:Myosin head (motor domain)
VLCAHPSLQDYEISGNDSDEIEDLKLRNVPGQATVCEGAKVEDLTRLTHLHEPAILSSLHSRYQANTIYTYTGPILLAVNPFQRVPLYSDVVLESYKADGERRVFDPKCVPSPTRCCLFDSSIAKRCAGVSSRARNASRADVCCRSAAAAACARRTRPGTWTPWPPMCTPSPTRRTAT